ncbi:Lantibiotic transport ATP-binding protein srtF [Amylolactobacillus amylotrophicus DSM 20534]|uniref:Uncharacterized protein n=4 Tax=Amylolactobacillus TaxID=2767876 RepID=A0A1L6XC18_9LACO|nr:MULTISPECIES: ABC transporter ATP-binding protein [Amylolactobacillus]APT18537.1 hypothetical protein LA20533_04335 [Amylolactobacillus amylophilus DSM 20533 = JCM 1125]KRK37603.1 Lantibiotic transport ATP-binding protein srtF [Amylolactobacillus amylotrophicus DSM 20534]KRM43578.1 Lantibiotic transport ATP-binding protein srtF [Amylolactobacillus amylophilus DSM 20533 = JCM 1125]GED80330.1 putative ABC transporter ATP-binding protein YhcH [Amylolactobacillus amylophilus]
MNESGYAVEVKHLDKVIKHRQILSDVSFTLKPGRILGLLGPNGAGKTTTMRIMVQLMKATSGEISIVGHDVQKDFVGAMTEVGTLIESPDFYNYMSGFKNLRLLADVSRKSISNDEITAVLERVGLLSVARDKVGSYSLGMRQRLGLAQAILHKPSVLILDEPMNGLDPQGAREIRDLLREFKNEDFSVIISSHLLSDIQQLADDIVLMKGGKVAYDGTLQELLAKTHHDIVLTVEDATAAAGVFTAENIAYKQNGMTFTVAVQENAENERLALARLLNRAQVLVTDIHVEGDNLEESFLTFMGTEDRK